MMPDRLSPIGLYRFVRPLLFSLSPERAHRAALWGLRLGLWPRDEADDPSLALSLWNLRFSNPLGLAAGFDKDGEAMEGAFRLGFGFVEVGSVTPLPQSGNPRPRLFRLPRAGAIINRMGFNNSGVMAMGKRLAAYLRQGRPSTRVLGVNLGKNKESADAVADYAIGARMIVPFADYIVVNVSSPNTPGLRDLQRPQAILALSAALREAIRVSDRPVPILLKIAPDLMPEELADIAAIVIAGAFDGMIISNTTLSRSPLLDPEIAQEPGGMSGAPLFDLSTRLLSDAYRLTEGKVPMIGVGGVGSGAEAYAKIKAGASLVELYTALIYRGPGLIQDIKRYLVEAMKRDGYATIGEAIGADHRAFLKKENAAEKGGR